MLQLAKSVETSLDAADTSVRATETPKLLVAETNSSGILYTHYMKG